MIANNPHTINPHTMHLSIAETGKLKALKSDHKGALKHYREALRLAVSSRAPEVFFRHYTQCVLESLELTGAYDEVLDYCINADAHYESLNLSSSLHRRDHGSILERQGLVELKKGDAEQGHKTLRKACAIAGEKILPLSEEIINWLQRGFSLDVTRITTSQRKHDYFVVRADQVDRKRASTVPTSTLTSISTSRSITNDKQTDLYEPTNILGG
jgi:hypothetical protein